MEEDNTVVRYLLEQLPEYHKRLEDELKIYYHFIEDVINKLKNIEFVLNVQPIKIDIKPLQDEISRINHEIKTLEDPKEKIDKLKKQQIFLEHKKLASRVKDKIMKYLKSLKWHEKCRNAKLPRQALTNKQRKMFDILVTRVCDFGISVKTKGKKGETVKRLALEFASDVRPGKVLSEGEQKACAIADFLTEVNLDSSNCGIIFDDPVTSLDHKRKRKIAKRLVFEAKKRQVIIFTHDIVFLSYLVEIAEDEEVKYASHWIEKIDDRPGKVFLNKSPKLATLSNQRKLIDDIYSEAKKTEDPQRRNLLNF